MKSSKMIRTNKTESTYSFGPFTIDFNSNELNKLGQPVKLRHQSLQLLAFLIRHVGRPVSREQIAQHLWQNTEIDFDQRLNAAMRDLRKALGDSAEEPRYIQTLPRTGYRFNPETHKTKPDRWRRPILAISLFFLLASLFYLLSQSAAPTNTIPTKAQELFIQAKVLIDSKKPEQTAQAETRH